MSENPIAHIDLRTGIPKVRPMLDQLEPGNCRYTAPCVIGAMMSEDERERLAVSRIPGVITLGNVTRISTLAEAGQVEMPSDQIDDARTLQSAFDNYNREEFLATFDRIAAKYETPHA